MVKLILVTAYTVPEHSTYSSWHISRREEKKNYSITCCDILTSAIRILPVAIVGGYHWCDYSLTYHNITIPQYQTAAADCAHVSTTVQPPVTFFKVRVKAKLASPAASANCALSGIVVLRYCAM